MIRINLQPVETAPSVKWTRYLLSDTRPRPALFLVPPRYTPTPEPVESKALPLEWLLDPDKARSDADHVLAALIQLEAHEPNPHLRDDYREMFIAIRLGLKGDPEPLVSASYRMFGLHPDKVYAAILARRKALLGKEMEAVNELPRLSDGARENRPTESGRNVLGKVRLQSAAAIPAKEISLTLPSPKKPVQSVKSPRKEEAA
jgi:hypothetical protein